MTNKPRTFAAVILAAGKSSRFGGQKVLVDWHGQPLIRHIVTGALEAGLSPVIVVLGATGEPVRRSLIGLDVNFVHNSEYEKGMGTSLRSGFAAVPRECTGVFLFLSDQPCVNQSLIQKMAEHHSSGEVIIPTYKNQPGHPVLWDNKTFDRITNMSDDETGRGIQKDFSCFLLDCPDPMILRDIDTRDDYQRLVDDHISGQSEQ